MKNNINENTSTLYLADNFLLGNLIKETVNLPTIAFQNITNSYSILKEIEKTNITNITFVLRIRRVFRDLLPLGYNLDTKIIRNYRDFFDEDFNVDYTLNKAA